ncbi:outer membrane beta-barrel protein [Persicitalea sp.]|uniref:outer membrane beta-barrel protein n=1 Tax=Persicitalea sp. TaxID=3100273 RepID=UPI003593B4FF
MKFFTKLVALLLVSAPLCAQNTQRGSVSGSVLDEKNVAFPYVNVLLLKAKDSTLAKGMTSDTDGKFAFETVEAGRYFTLVSMVGYQKVHSPVFTVANAEVKLSPVTLTNSVELLNEVKVVAQKPFIEQQIDRTVVNVENSIVSAGATALEILERSPGVVVDQQNDALKLRGKNGVLVQIDGKRSYLSQTELMNLLRNTPSDNIEKIELITNPSAKYDAAGNSGIINIVFKKNKNYGTNGSVTFGGGYMPDLSVGRTNGSLALNHRQGKINIFGNSSVYTGGNVNTNNIYRTIPFEGKVTIFDQESERRSNYRNYSFRAGMDYSLNDKTTVGVLASAFSNDWSQPEGVNNTQILDGNSKLIRSFLTEASSGQKMNNLTGNLNVKHKFDDKGKELTFDADYVRYGGQSFNQLNTNYFKPNGLPDGSPELVRNDMPSTINIGVIKLDYAQTIGKGKFETGLKSSYVTSDNNLTFEVKVDVWQIDPTRTNRFKYTENINAAYVNYGGKLGEKTSYQLGFRLEHTHSVGNSVTLNDVRDRNYINLFPSVFLSRQLDSSNVLNLSYSRRIDRPDYQSLNPFEFYLDPFTFQRGNPNLRPQYTHALQLTHVYKDFLNTSISYSRISDLIANEVPRQIASENKTFVTTENLDNQDNINLTVSVPIPVTKWWTLQANLTGSYNRYKTYYGDALYDVNQLNYNVFASNQFKMANDWSAELSGWYNSPAVYGFFVSNPQGMINMGLQKSIWEKKGTLRLNVSDIFWMNKFRGRAQFQDIDLRVRSTWASRQVRLTFTYRFGNQNVKGARQRNTGSDDLQQRVKSN